MKSSEHGSHTKSDQMTKASDFFIFKSFLAENFSAPSFGGGYIFFLIYWFKR